MLTSAPQSQGASLGPSTTEVEGAGRRSLVSIPPELDTALNGRGAPIPSSEDFTVV